MNFTPYRPQSGAVRTARWQRYLADLQNYAALPQPLESSGTLVRVTGLVLEAAGVRAPVGAVCEVLAEGQAPVLAEVGHAAIEFFSHFLQGGGLLRWR